MEKGEGQQKGTNLVDKATRWVETMKKQGYDTGLFDLMLKNQTIIELLSNQDFWRGDLSPPATLFPLHVSLKVAGAQFVSDNLLSISTWNQQTLDAVVEEHIAEIKATATANTMAKNMPQKAGVIASVLPPGLSSWIHIDLGSSMGLIPTAFQIPELFKSWLETRTTIPLTMPMKPIASIGIELVKPSDLWGLACIDDDALRMDISRFLELAEENRVQVIEASAHKINTLTKVQQLLQTNEEATPVVTACSFIYQLTPDMRTQLLEQLCRFAIANNAIIVFIGLKEIFFPELNCPEQWIVWSEQFIAGEGFRAIEPWGLTVKPHYSWRSLNLEQSSRLERI